MEFIGIGDLHFDSPLKKYIPDYDKALGKELSKVLKYAQNSGVEHIVLFGDVSETPRLSYEAYLVLLDVFLKHTDLQIHIILGNHCKQSKDSTTGHSLDIFKPLLNNILKHVHIYEEDTKVEIDNVPFNFLPWPSTAFCKKSVNIAHIEVDGVKTDSGHIMKGKNLHKGDELILSGHIHTRHLVRNTHYVSTLMQQDFGESEKRYFVHVKTKGPKQTKIDYVRHKPKHLLRTVVIDCKEDVKLIPKDPNILVRLIVKDGIDVDPALWVGYPNIIYVTPFKTKEELRTVLATELKDGADIKFSVVDFLEAYLESVNTDSNEIKTALSLRSKIIGGN